MTTQAQYNAAGQITATIGPSIITDPNQVAALTAQGISLVVIPDGKSASTGSIVNGAYQDYPAAGAPIPSIMLQYVADQINQGNSNIASYHGTSIAQLNAALTTVGLATLTPAATNTAATPAS